LLILALFMLCMVKRYGYLCVFSTGHFQHIVLYIGTGTRSKITRIRRDTA
jgi:hypothetical protein